MSYETTIDIRNLPIEVKGEIIETSEGCGQFSHKFKAVEDFEVLLHIGTKTVDIQDYLTQDQKDDLIEGLKEE